MRLNINDIRYIISESKKLLLTEISNNAIESLFKKYLPEYVDLMDFTLKELDTSTYEYDGAPFYYYLHLMDVPSSAIKETPDMKLKDYLRLSIMKTFEINRGKGPIRFMRGITRILCGDRDISFFNIHRKNENNLTKFKQVVQYLYSNNIEMDGDFNGMSFSELYKAVGKDMRISNYVEYNKIRRESESLKKVYGEYVVKPMYSYNDTSKYEGYNEWCVTYSIGNYTTYTNDGSQFFFCLKNGFENVPKRMGEDCPLDEYGLSMVSVLVYPNGTAKRVTTRWNHDNDGEDHPDFRTLEDVENILGIPKEVFIQNRCPNIEIDDINDLLKRGVSVDELSSYITVIKEFGKFKLIRYNNKAYYNILNGNELFSDIWYTDYDYDRIDKNNVAIVLSRIDEKSNKVTNVFTPEGKLFPQDIPCRNIYISSYEKGIYILYDYNNKCNLIRKGETKPILKKFVGHISSFVNGYAFIKDNGTINFIDEEGNMLWKTNKVFPEIKHLTSGGIFNGKVICLMDIFSDIMISFIDINGNYIAPPNLKVDNSFKESPNDLFIKDENTGEKYQFNTDTAVLTKLEA